MTKAKKEKTINNIGMMLLETSTAICDKCDKEEQVEGDAAENADYFYDEGWRATERYLYCKKCAKKYLKQ